MPPLGGSWEPLEKQQYLMDHRIRLRREKQGIPAGEMGWIVKGEGTTSLVKFDYFPVPVHCAVSLLEAWVPQGIHPRSSKGVQTCLKQPTVEAQAVGEAERAASAVNVATQTDKEVFHVYLDEGASSTVPLVCDRMTQYDKVIFDCKAACDRLHLALNLTSRPGPRDDREKMLELGDILRRVDEAFEDACIRLKTYRLQTRRDSQCQTGRWC